MSYIPGLQCIEDALLEKNIIDQMSQTIGEEGDYW